MNSQSEFDLVHEVINEEANQVAENVEASIIVQQNQSESAISIVTTDNTDQSDSMNQAKLNITEDHPHESEQAEQAEAPIMHDNEQANNANNTTNKTEPAVASASSNETTIEHVPIQIIDFQQEWDQLTDNEKMLGLLAPIWLPGTYKYSSIKRFMNIYTLEEISTLIFFYFA